MIITNSGAIIGTTGMIITNSGAIVTVIQVLFRELNRV